jgi:uncharacterized lipoprotein YmbA
MKMTNPSRSVCAFILSAITFSGCTLFESAPVRYYALSAAPADSSTSSPRGGPAFAIASVRIPQYLSHKWIVTRNGETEISLAADDQWAAPLADDIGRVLSENLTAMIPSDRVVQLPLSAAVPIDYEIRVEIISFERQADGTVDLVARWTVFGDGGRRLVTMNRSAFRTTDVPNDYPSITRAMSSLIAELSREIAATMQRLPATAARRNANPT